MGNPAPGFSAIIYGQPKSGKSTLSALAAGHLASRGKRVYYASLEEGLRATVSDRFQRLGVGHPNLEVWDCLMADLSGYDYVVVDSASRGLMDVDKLRKLLASHPKTSFLIIFHTTKAGLPRGDNGLMHEVDGLIEVKDGRATSRGRYGNGEMEIEFNPNQNNQ